MYQYGPHFQNGEIYAFIQVTDYQLIQKMNNQMAGEIDSQKDFVQLAKSSR